MTRRVGVDDGGRSPRGAKWAFQPADGAPILSRQVRPWRRHAGGMLWRPPLWDALLSVGQKTRSITRSALSRMRSSRTQSRSETSAKGNVGFWSRLRPY